MCGSLRTTSIPCGRHQSFWKGHVRSALGDPHCWDLSYCLLSLELLLLDPCSNLGAFMSESICTGCCDAIGWCWRHQSGNECGLRLFNPSLWLPGCLFACSAYPLPRPKPSKKTPSFRKWQNQHSTLSREQEPGFRYNSLTNTLQCVLGWLISGKKQSSTVLCPWKWPLSIFVYDLDSSGVISFNYELRIKNTYRHLIMRIWMTALCSSYFMKSTETESFHYGRLLV